MLTPNEAYQYDPTFHRVVDLMCAYLSEYQITPSELRQAAILAATMHEARRIRPLYIAPKLNCICGYTGTCATKDLHSQTCKDYNWAYWHPVDKRP